MPKASREHIAGVVDASLGAWPDPTGQVLNVLGDVQAALGYVPDEALACLSERTGTPVEQLASVRGFFKDLSAQPVGETLVVVCDGTACHMRRAPELLLLLEQELGVKAGETSPDGRYTLRTAGCLGSCGIAPVMMVNGRMFGNVRLSDAVQVVKYAESSDGARDAQQPA